MKKTNKKLAAGTLICALTSTGVMSAQAASWKEAAKKSGKDILKTGAAIVGGGLIIDKLANLFPRAANVIGKIGSTVVAKPVKLLGSKALDIASNAPVIGLIGVAAIAAYALYAMSETYFKDRVDEKVQEKFKNNNNSSGNHININVNSAGQK